MSGRDIFVALGELSPDIVLAAEPGRKYKTMSHRAKIASLAACFLVAVIGILLLPLLNREEPIIPSPDVPIGGALVSGFDTDGGTGDTTVNLPEDGEVVFSVGVYEARLGYKNEDARFLLALDVFLDGEELSGEELNREYSRLFGAGYELYRATDYWTYNGDGEKQYKERVVGVFTEAELASFSESASELYGYAFSFATRGDGTAISIDKAIPLK